MSKPSDEHRCQILRAILDSTDVMVCTVDAERFALLAFNSAMARHFATKYGRELRSGVLLEDLFGPDDVAMWRGYFFRALRDGSFGTQHRGIVEGRTFSLSFNRVTADDVCVGVSVFCRDITDLQQAAHVAETAEDRFAKIFRGNPCPLQVNDAETGVMVDVNDAFAAWLGYQRSELIGHSTTDFGIWVDPSTRQRKLERVRAAGRVSGGEVRYRHRDGRIFDCLICCETIVLDGRRCFLVSTTDITTLRTAEQALRESELRNRALIETAPEAIVVIDTESGEFVDANENAARLAGYDKASLLKLNPRVLGRTSLPDGDSRVIAGRVYRERAMAGEPQTFEWPFLRPDGRRVECEVRLSSLFDGKRRLLRASVIDITERKRLEREAAAMRVQLEHAQRMEALGRLSCGIAHDFNNVVNAIIGQLDLALRQVQDGDLRSLLEDCEQAAKRAMGLVRQIRDFGRQKRDKRPIEAVPVIKEAVKLLRVDLPRNIVLSEVYQSSGRVLADPTQIHQVVVNLFTNARLAMAGRGGRLDIAVEERVLDARLIPQYPWAKAVPHLCLSVKDTGCGMTSETIDLIFEPFFTTRPEGVGTGMGLSVVYGIVKDAGGAIGVKSEMGSGSTFDVYLPLLPPDSPQGGPDGKAPGTP